MEPYVKRLRIPAISLLLARWCSYPHTSRSTREILTGRTTVPTPTSVWFLHVSDLHVGVSGPTTPQPAVARWRGPADYQPIVCRGHRGSYGFHQWERFRLPERTVSGRMDQYKAFCLVSRRTSSTICPATTMPTTMRRSPTTVQTPSRQGWEGTAAVLDGWLGTRKYHFLGVNTAGNNGASFSLFRPWAITPASTQPSWRSSIRS